jgi:uncharacterized protein DUF1360
MVDNPVKMAARPASRTTAKTAPRSTAAVAKRTAAKASNDPRPLEGHAGILASYAVLTGALVFKLRRRSSDVRQLRPMDLLLYGLATEHLSRVITEGEVNEDVIGTGAKHAIGELVTCPFCIAQWVATALIAGSVASPSLATAVVSVSAVARFSDYLDLLYGVLRKGQ